MKTLRYLLPIFVIAIFSALALLPGTAAAKADNHKLKYIHVQEVQEDDQSFTRIEVGMSGKELQFSAHNRVFFASQYVVDMERTELDEVEPNMISNTSLVAGISLLENENGSLSLKVLGRRALEENECQAYTLPADKKQKKPLRLIIDIGKKSAADMVEGVAGHTIVLDPGHGGTDAGASGPGGLREKDVTLEVALMTRDILEASGATVIMTREDDRDVYGPTATDAQELQARVDYGLYNPQAEIFVSIHCNAFSSAKAHGTEAYYYEGYEDQRLASLLYDEMIKAGGLTTRGVKEARLYVLTHSEIPASLVELAFITNYREEGLLSTDDFKYAMAKAIATGMGRFFMEK